MRTVGLLFGMMLLSACSALPTTFTTENIMKVQQGMSSNDILKTFGPPKNVGQSMCGTSTPNPWPCTTWDYGEFPYQTASFTFSGNAPDSLVLNHFKIDRD